MRRPSFVRLLGGGGVVAWHRVGGFYQSETGGARSLVLWLAVVLPLLATCAPPADVWSTSSPAASLRDLVQEGAYAVVEGDVSVEESADGADGMHAAGTSGAAVAPLRFSTAPRVQRVASGLHWRTAVVTQPGIWTWDVDVPPGGRLHLGLDSFARAGAQGDPTPLELSVAVSSGERRKVLRVASPREIDAPDWLDLELRLDRWAGRRVRIEVETRAVGRADPRAAPAELAWSPARIVAPGSIAAPIADTVASVDGARAVRRGPPSILLVVVDTLRPDYLSPYGGARWNSPNIARRLAAEGVLFERAYAPAPWTLPSMVGLMTGTLPGAVLGQQAGSFAIPPEQPTLAELLQSAGYETAAFIGNPTLHQGNGFGRGLDDIYISPPETAFVTLEDELLVRKASRWLRARGGRPFFAHVHFLAPHDPYANPVQFLGRSPRRPFYLGRITGRDVHELFLGTKALDDPAEDLPHLRALYASEVRWSDHWVGELLDALPDERLRDTIVVLTSDHGEELYEHGDWKHGRTLYEEQLRVPLVVRWDGAIRERRRIEAPVRLIDVAPTLLDAARVAVPDPLAGRSFLAQLIGEGEPEAADAFAERLNFGPLQAAVVSRGQKLVLFDLHGAAAAENEMQERRIEEEARRQPRVALYDLERDPGERRNLAAEEPALLRRLSPLLHRGLDRTLPGLRVLAGEVPAGSRLDVTVTFDAPPAEWRSYFLGGSDGVGVVGRELRLDLAADVVEKGVVVLGDWRRIESIAVRLDEAAVDLGRVWTPVGRLEKGAPIELAALSGVAPAWGRAETAEASSEPPLVYLWVPPAGAAAAPERGPDAETLHRLRALGYL